VRHSPLERVTLALLPAMLLMALGASLSYLGGGPLAHASTAEPGFRGTPHSVPAWMRALPGAPTETVNSAPTLQLALGLGTIQLSILLALAGVFRLARREELLTWTTESLELTLPGRHEHIAWDEVERVRWDDALGTILLTRRYGEPMDLAWPTNADEGMALAERLESVRRKASWGLLPEQRRRRGCGSSLRPPQKT